MARREDVVVQSCPLCLRADEAPSMVAVEVPQGPGNASWRWLLCRQCAGAIADAWERLAFEDSREKHRSDLGNVGSVQQRYSDLPDDPNRDTAQPGAPGDGGATRTGFDTAGSDSGDSAGDGTERPAEAASELVRSEDSGK